MWKKGIEKDGIEMYVVFFVLPVRFLFIWT